MRKLLCIAVVLMVLIAWGGPGAALAQYYNMIEPGYELVKVGETGLLSMASPHPLVLAAQDACGLALDGLFEVRGGMRRFFTLEWSEEGEGEFLVEYEIVPDYEPAQPAVPASYKFEGGGVYIGWGHDPSEDWNPAVVVSFFVGEDGGVEELARWECGAQWVYGVYALDLTGSGGVDLVVPWATGAGGGGGVEMFAVVPTGGFSGWGDDLMQGSFWSSNGATDLVDWDADGDWELSAYFPLLFSAAGYYYTELMTFDQESYSWIDARAIAPELYTEQEGFYIALAAEIRQFIKHPEQYKIDDPEGWVSYGCTIDGELCSLDPFILDEDGTPDYTWVDTLLEFADGFAAE